MLMGPGAGGMPTATAVVGDMVSIATAGSLSVLEGCTCHQSLGFYPSDEVESAFFVKMNVEDVSGVLARIATVLGEHGVSIESMIQKGRGEEAELVLITHPTKERNFLAAIAEAEAFPCCKSKPMTLRVLQ